MEEEPPPPYYARTMASSDRDKSTELIHLTYDGNFQLYTDAKVILCRVIKDSSSTTTDDDTNKYTNTPFG